MAEATPYTFEEVAADHPALPIVRGLLLGLKDMLLGLGCDVASFQGFEDEVATLPAMYVPDKGGRLFVATRRRRDGDDDGRAVGEDNVVVGCVAYKRILDDTTCEMKRMFVHPSERRSGLGRRLSVLCMERAKGDGYTRMVLDTLERLPAAVKLYESMGFAEVEPYVFNPMPDVKYFGQAL